MSIPSGRLDAFEASISRGVELNCIETAELIAEAREAARLRENAKHGDETLARLAAESGRFSDICQELRAENEKLLALVADAPPSEFLRMENAKLRAVARAVKAYLADPGTYSASPSDLSGLERTMKAAGYEV